LARSSPSRSGSVASSANCSPRTRNRRSYYQGETRHGRFYRRLPLPAKANLEQIKANHKDDVLEIRVPMPARPKVALA